MTSTSDIQSSELRHRTIGSFWHTAFECIAIGLLTLALRAALLPIRPIPAPAVHDEFSYLLGADTFCRGRLTNPPHPMWEHFETLHEIVQPTYASKYPPGQALVLALGWKLFGDPWLGVWLSCGLMCASLYWMLRGWMARRYAMLGGLMAVAQWGVAGYWVNSYFGGAVAAASGALVVGALPRWKRRPRRATAVIAALGAVGLAFSRPYEGGLLAVAVLAACWMGRRRPLAWRAIAPAVVILAGGLVFGLYYNHRVTGNALQMPYMLHQQQYGASPIFWIMPPQRPPEYRHETIRRLWVDWDARYYEQARSVPPRVAQIFVNMLRFFLTPVSAIALFTALAMRGGRKVWVAMALAGVLTAGLLLERNSTPHYFAPAAGLILLLVMLGAQAVRVRFGRKAYAAFSILFFAGAAIQASRLSEYEYPHAQFAACRQRAIKQLEDAGGRHLVIVRYAPQHDLMEEWVYNRADIDASDIVWARDMGDRRNRELIEYYPGRHAWLLEPDALSGRTTSSPSP